MLDVTLLVGLPLHLYDRARSLPPAIGVLNHCSSAAPYVSPVTLRPIYEHWCLRSLGYLRTRLNCDLVTGVRHIGTC